DGHAITAAAGFEFAKIALVFDGAIGLDVEGHDGAAIGDVERLFIAAQHDAIGANILSDGADLAGWTEVEDAAAGEIDVALLADDQIIDAAEGLAADIVGEHLAFGSQNSDVGGLLAVFGFGAEMATRIGTGAFDGEYLAFGVHGDSARSV